MNKLFIIFALLMTVGCSITKSEGEVNSKTTLYRYGSLVKIKEGLFKEFQCAIIREYETQIFCKVLMMPDGNRMNEEWSTRQNFEKSNVDIVK